ncbi:3-deoxy-manno-octulosonate-8-phosphatase KdsC [Moritella sp. F3]|uniref:3-deoxy-manno-octulosonate-8-phosphatase KdsC n=1 Tax=Moritella sp. F3 TaxID=2718882 RepID=UPI0018E1A315|nr:3-deoxy-manno-octulosonate-8-phosphatase KdsC [Moritella sp. F3]GIC76111.1 3-deoxy-D-manno-octulosonate 8-phosphate phosphatase [Moritella sp. F1]GIC82786.1 3-deoxy-D-manno-octulosonate 8-phosphate phosphatase [Moritella sp. F3]
MINTLYGPISQDILTKAKTLKLLICDIDGVFSDGRVYMGNDGEELKAFHTRDGFGVKSLLNAGIEVAVITGRQSTIVANRMQGLGVKHVYQGQDNKVVAFNMLLEKLNISPEHVAYIGDDVIDLPVMNLCGLSVAVADAHPLVKKGADFSTSIRGGFGAVRELADLILLAKGILDQAQGTSV